MSGNKVFSGDEKVDTLVKIFGEQVRSYSKSWINNYFEDYKFYNCSPETYRRLLRTRG